jgi:hypothetical protein
MTHPDKILIDQLSKDFYTNLKQVIDYLGSQGTANHRRWRRRAKGYAYCGCHLQGCENRSKSKHS